MYACIGVVISVFSCANNIYITFENHDTFGFE